jgi:hypothetical protein
MAWKLEDTYFESCSCEVVCPCMAPAALGAAGRSAFSNPCFSWAA